MESKGLLCNVLRGKHSENAQAVKELNSTRKES
jgi:hypothetical protein